MRHAFVSWCEWRDVGAPTGRGFSWAELSRLSPVCSVSTFSGLGQVWLLWLHFHRGKVLQNKRPRRDCLRSTIEHTQGLSSGFSLDRFPAPLTVMQTGWMDSTPSLAPANLAAPQGVNAVPLHTAKQHGSKGGSNCFSRTSRGIGRCNDLIVFFHSLLFDHRRAIGSPYDLKFPNPDSCRDLSFN